MAVTIARFMTGALVGHEPQRQNNALLVIRAESGDVAIPGADTITLACETFPMPKMDGANFDLKFLGQSHKFVGAINYSDMTVECRDLVTLDVRGQMYEWFRMVWDTDTGVKGFAGGAGTKDKDGRFYKRNGYILVFPPDGNAAPETNTQWDVYGIWPMSLDFGNADQNTEEYVRISVTFSVDRIAMFGGTFNTPPILYSAMATAEKPPI